MLKKLWGKITGKKPAPPAQQVSRTLPEFLRNHPGVKPAPPTAEQREAMQAMVAFRLTEKRRAEARAAAQRRSETSYNAPSASVQTDWASRPLTEETPQFARLLIRHGWGVQRRRRFWQLVQRLGLSFQQRLIQFIRQWRKQ